MSATRRRPTAAAKALAVRRSLARRRKLCAACQERRFGFAQGRQAKFSHRGRVKADRDHVLCFQCYRAETNRARARALAAAVQPRLSFEHATVLTPRQAAHRHRMLAHLAQNQARRRSARQV